jgi:glycosyltransferase involved in cell wall biosynthesis
MKVCGIPCDFDGSGSYRVLQPFRELNKRGHDCSIPPNRRKQEGPHKLILFDFNKIQDADVYVLQRRLEPEWVSLSAALRELGKVVVAETDDWFLGLPSYNPASRGTSPNKRSFGVDADGNLVMRVEKRAGNRNNMHESFRHASVLTVSTPFLAEQYSRFNPNVKVLPNFLDWNVWENVTPQYEVEPERIRIGYMGSLKFHRNDLAILKGLIGPFMRKHPECVFVASGNDGEEVHDFLEIPDDQRHNYGEARFRFLPQITAVMDIGLVPLELNNFNEAKSDVKGKEYAACGVPCIASPTESYRGWVEEGSNGFLARKPRQWLNHLEALVSDDDLRRSMGRAAREKARRHTIQENVGMWEDTYASLVGESKDVGDLFSRL